jgi:nucleotide-binding universal stress UspA family protein
MYRKIMAPVDLSQGATQEKALKTAADLARLYGASVTYVGVTETTPGAVAHNPQEFGRKLAEFAAAQARQHGITADSHAYVANDPAVELDETLVKAARELGADLIVMATHAPRIFDRLFGSHGGGVATHVGVSVMLVR